MTSAFESAPLVKSLFHEKLDSGDKLIGAAVGSGMSSRHLLAGGADFLLIATGGKFRSAGVPSLSAFLPMGNANDMIFDLAVHEVLPRAVGKPVILGLCATDPAHDCHDLLLRARDAGFHGVNNFPSVGIYQESIRKMLEKGGVSFQREVDFLAEAASLGLFTLGFAFNEDHAVSLAKAGVDAICVNLLLPFADDKETKGYTSPEEAVFHFSTMFSKAERIKPDFFKIFYCAGPISTPENLDMVMQKTGADGYIGGSIFERIPTAAAMEEITGQYKKIINLSHENKELRRELLKKKGFDEIVGQSGVMQDLYEVVNKVAEKNVNVLIVGESGTGKELVVKAIHYNSSRRNQPFIKVNCAAIPETLLESELFGYAKGAFTGAVKDKMGFFQLADKGTLFLDEIGEISLSTQAKLLRVIQQKEMQAVGSATTVKLDFRLVTATNVDLQQLVASGKFRQDLFYRLNVVSIHTPALRTHKEDIPLLLNFFLRRIGAKFEQPPCRLTPDAFDVLLRYDWPGNVRQLEHAIESASILCSDYLIQVKHLPQVVRDFVDAGSLPSAAAPHQEPLEQNALPSAPAGEAISDERSHIIAVLTACNWKRDKAAQQLGVSRKTLYNKMRKHGIS